MQRENFPLQGIDFLFSWSRCKYQLPTILVVCKLSTYYTNKCKNIIFPKNCLSLHKYVVYLCFLEPPSETTNYYMYVYNMYILQTSCKRVKLNIHGAPYWNIEWVNRIQYGGVCFYVLGLSRCLDVIMSPPLFFEKWRPYHIFINRH